MLKKYLDHLGRLACNKDDYWYLVRKVQSCLLEPACCQEQYLHHARKVWSVYPHESDLFVRPACCKEDNLYLAKKAWYIFLPHDLDHFVGPAFCRG